MPFYIEQVEGKLKEASRELWEAVKDGDNKRAMDIYLEHIGTPWPDHLTIEHNRSWWLFNAPRAIKTNYGSIYEAGVEEFGGIREVLFNEERFFEFLRKKAERELGGRWRVCYEY